MIMEEMTLNNYMILKQTDTSAHAYHENNLILDVVDNYTDLAWRMCVQGFSENRWIETRHNIRVIVWRTPQLKDLTSYERLYLQRSFGKPTISLPRSSKSIDRFWTFNLTERTGIVSGRYVVYQKTPLAEKLIQEMQS